MVRVLVPSIVVLAIACCSIATAAPLQVCIDDQAALPGVARAVLVQELGLLFPSGRLASVSDACDSKQPETVVLSVKPERPSLPASVLGLAVRSEHGIAPNVEVFVNPLKRYTGARGWEALSRAMARVAAHELLHYLHQSDQHTSHGLLQEALTRNELTRKDARPLLMAVRLGD